MFEFKNSRAMFCSDLCRVAANRKLHRVIKSKTVELNGGMYKYIIPLGEPSDEKEIINFDLKRPEQFWRTPAIPDVKRMSTRDRIRFVERERQRWAEGVYVLINGDLVYLTGMHYDHLTYMSFKSGKAEFFKHQCLDFYFRDLTRRDIKCRGRTFMKPRRYGMTMEEITEGTYSLLENFSNNVALQSDIKDKTKSTLLNPMIQSYVKRPKYMRSDYYKPNGKMPVAQLELKSTLAPGDDGEEKGDFLLGWLKPFPALPRSMDGEEVAYSIMDEVWKWQESSPKETLESNIKVLMGRKRAGKVSMLSTMGDSDDYANSIMDGFDIIARSNPNIRDDNGYTLSGLYEYFVSAIYSFDIPPDVFEVDKFGEVNVDKHTEYIQNKLRKLDKNSKSYVFEKRRLPLTKQDALLSSQTSTNFRRVVINDRLSELIGTPINQKPYLRGMLEEDRYGKVYFISDAERQKIAGDVEVDAGIWLWAVQPYFSIDKGIDMRNRFKMINGIYYPYRQIEGGIGYDPINYTKSQITTTHFSRAAIAVKKKYDYVFKEGDEEYLPSAFMGLCIFRPDDPRDPNKEAIKAAKFTGYRVMHEKSVNHVYEDFEAAGMLPFLSRDPKSSEENPVYGISPSDMLAKKDGLAMLQTRYSQPKIEGQRDELKEYPFEDGLRDLDNFDIGNTNPYDVTMAEIYAEHELKQNIFSNQVDGTEMDLYRLMQELNPPRRA